jgi:hypothetical protein
MLNEFLTNVMDLTTQMTLKIVLRGKSLHMACVDDLKAPWISEAFMPRLARPN